ncbi:MAG: hypothetical protein DME63_03440 [Verrucomicrobia bacterium]|nr:MAG: hypothetical protein DME63_03440 [Verrucomicrobiota bacterium]
MKPTAQFDKECFPGTDCFFQSGAGRWHGYWSSDDDGQFRRYNLGREYLIESARERAKEMAVFAVILVAAAWPVIYMIVSVVQLLHKGRTLDR